MYVSLRCMIYNNNRLPDYQGSFLEQQAILAVCKVVLNDFSEPLLMPVSRGTGGDTRLQPAAGADQYFSILTARLLMQPPRRAISKVSYNPIYGLQPPNSKLHLVTYYLGYFCLDFVLAWHFPCVVPFLLWTCKNLDRPSMQCQRQDYHGPDDSTDFSQIWHFKGCAFKSKAFQ